MVAGWVIIAVGVAGVLLLFKNLLLDEKPRFRNPVNGYEEEVVIPPWFGALLFGGVYFLAKGIWTHATVCAVMVLLSAMGAWPLGVLCWLIYPFFARTILHTHYGRKGWQQVHPSPAETAEEKKEEAA